MSKERVIETTTIHPDKPIKTPSMTTNPNLIPVDIVTENGKKVADFYKIVRIPRVGEFIHLPEGQIRSGYHIVLAIAYSTSMLNTVTIVINKVGYRRYSDFIMAIHRKTQS